MKKRSRNRKIARLPEDLRILIKRGGPQSSRKGQRGYNRQKFKKFEKTGFQ
jgi:hypothetical protein